MPRTERHADGALRIRRAAIRLFAGQSTPAEFLDSTAAVGEGGWTVFLTIEQCAEPLRQRLGTPNPLLDRFALGEIQRTLSARSQLRAIADLATTHGWKVVVLKGGVAAAETTVYLLDVDILAPADIAVPLLEQLARRLGLRPDGPVSKRHLPTLGGEGMLPIEVHRNIDNRWTRLTEPAWTRVIPLPAVSGLLRLAPRDHLLHMLTHVVIDHAERRGRLRDSLLLQQAAADCSPADLAAVTAEVGGTPHAAAMMDQLRFARALGGEASGLDLLEPEAFSRFWLYSTIGRGTPQRIRLVKLIENTVWATSMALVAAWPLGQILSDGLREPRARLSKFGPTAWLERRAPRLGHAVRVGIRATHYALGVAAGIPLGWAIKRAARRMGVRTGSKA